MAVAMAEWATGDGIGMGRGIAIDGGLLAGTSKSRPVAPVANYSTH
jgi:hypothetical protein